MSFLIIFFNRYYLLSKIHIYILLIFSLFKYYYSMGFNSFKKKNVINNIYYTIL